MRLFLTAEDDTATCIACEGDVTQAQFPSNAFNPLEDLLGPDCYSRRVIVDFNQTSFIDSSGVGWLMICHKKFLVVRGKLILHSVPPMVDQVLRVLQLHHVLTIKPDLASSLAWAQQERTKG